MCDYAVMVDRRRQGVPRRPAAGEDGHRRGVPTTSSSAAPTMHSRVSGLSDYFAVDELDCIRIGREIVARPQLAQARPGAEPAAPTSRCYDADELLGIASVDLQGPVRPARGARPHRRRLAVRRVQAALRHQPGHRLGVGPRLPGRASSPTRRACCSCEEAQEGHRVHPAVQPDRHAAGVPAEHHRLHGRQATTSSAASSRTAPR